MSETPAAPQPSAEASPPPPKRKWRRRLKWIGGISLVMVVFLGATMGGAEYYTAKPQFCGTCHIMTPYYESWQKDPHATKADVACVDCHYAPGEHHTVMAKFRGLSQVASYFSGRAGAGRPKAHVNDASCLTSGCHGDNKYLDKPIKLGNVTFTHAKHLAAQGKIRTEVEQRTADLRTRLTASIGKDLLNALDLLAQPIEPAEAREKRLGAWIAQNALQTNSTDILAYAESLHTQLRVVQLEGLKCSSCHQFNSTLNTHFSAAMTTCYTCHFNNEPFNANTGRCLLCHEPPAKDVPIHGGDLSSPNATVDAPATTTAPVVLMNHAVILANNVNCASCHTDLIHGSGQVTRRDCQNCHDQNRYLKDFDHLTTEVVEDYHRVHAAGQRARCNDCHQLIDHKLMPLARIQDAVTLLTPVRQDCQHCHPDHHREQVELLLGQGGFVEGMTGVPNPMTGSRANCRACHTEAGSDPKDEKVITGTLESCRGCHGQEYVKLFGQWEQALTARLKEASELLATTEQRLQAATKPGDIDANLTEAARLVDRAKANIHLVGAANGIHNKNYALAVLDQAIHDLEEAGKRMAR